MTTKTDVAQELRTWAAGNNCMTAATELIIRVFDGRFAQTGNPWIQPRPFGGWYIDFETIPQKTGPLSSGEKAVLHIAAALGEDNLPVALGDEVSRLGREQLLLALAAIAHAAGSHQHSEIAANGDGTVSFARLPPAFPWPA